MIPLIRAEMRKLFTIRSTYFISIIALLLMGFICFWAQGYRGNPSNPFLMMEIAMGGINVLSLFMVIIAILAVTHEYRYNTILYTLTASNSRTKVLLAKLFVISAWTAFFTLVMLVFTLAMTWLGVVASGRELGPQTFYYTETLWRVFYFVLAYALMGYILGFLFRSVVGAMAIVFVMPTAIEGLLSLILKGNAKYLPFAALQQVSMPSVMSAAGGARVFALYLIAGLIAVWLLFNRRDTN